MPSIDDIRARAIQHYKSGELQQAQALCQQILQVLPSDHSTLHLMAVIAVTAGRSDLAEPLLRQSIGVFPLDPLVHANLGSVLSNLGKLDESVASFERALKLQADSLDALVGLAKVLNRRNDFHRAEELCRTALKYHPADAGAWHLLGDVLRLQCRYAEAEECFRATVEIDPRNSEAHNNLACTLHLLGNKSDAVDSYRKALDLAPNNHAPHSNIAVILQEQGRLDEAEAHLRMAIRLQPGMSEAVNNLGGILQLLCRLDEAMECFGTADALAPTNPSASGNLLLCMNYHPRFDPATLLSEHRKWGERFGRVPSGKIGPAQAHDTTPDRRLHVGYVSPDFRGHAISHFLSPILANHDPKQVEIFCYAELTKSDQTTEEMKAYVHGWRNTVGYDDRAMADLIRGDGIDVLVDLAGHTTSNRLLVFPHRPAPVQVTYLGYPNTTGLDCIDYRLTDAICDPPCEPPMHTEELFRLPRAFCCFAADRKAPNPGPLPALSAGFVTFGSLHSLARLNASVLDTWCNILHNVPNARLIVFRHTLRGKVKDELHRYFVGRGIAPHRIELAHEPPACGYSGVYHNIDISLDTFPWSGHTTACQSMWMGAPIITLRGNRFAGRMVASVLHHTGLSHLIANSLEEYVQIAVNLAGDLNWLELLREGLRRQISSSILCDQRGFTQELETAYREMWLKQRRH